MAQHLDLRCVFLSDASTLGAGAKPSQRKYTRIQIVKQRIKTPIILMCAPFSDSMELSKRSQTCLQEQLFTRLVQFEEVGVRVRVG